MGTYDIDESKNPRLQTKRLRGRMNVVHNVNVDERGMIKFCLTASRKHRYHRYKRGGSLLKLATSLHLFNLSSVNEKKKKKKEEKKKKKGESRGREKEHSHGIHEIVAGKRLASYTGSKLEKRFTGKGCHLCNEIYLRLEAR